MVGLHTTSGKCRITALGLGLKIALKQPGALVRGLVRRPGPVPDQVAANGSKWHRLAIDAEELPGARIDNKSTRLWIRCTQLWRAKGRCNPTATTIG
jgi:hypothetical protein